MGALLVMMLLIALLVCITEWKHIKWNPVKKILFVFTFPLFMATYVPIAFVALFKKVQWKPIPHTADVKIEELTDGAAGVPAEEIAPAAQAAEDASAAKISAQEEPASGIAGAQGGEKDG